MERIKRNDTVRVIAGKDRGTADKPTDGRVVRVYKDQGKVMVEGVNIVTKHQRVTRTRRGTPEGGISRVEAPIQMSNVMPICTSCDEPTRVGARVVDGRKVRVCRKCDSEF